MAVYFMIDENREFIKVGRSGNWERRLGDMNLHCPLEITMLALLDVENDSCLEAEFHRHLRPLNCRKQGEWFDAGVVAYFLATEWRIKHPSIEFFEDDFSLWDLANCCPRSLMTAEDNAEEFARCLSHAAIAKSAAGANAHSLRAA